MRRQSGFSITELLIVVAVIGVLATIAVPSLLSAIYRGKQKRTMADLRSLSAAVMAYGVDLNFVPLQPAEASITGIQASLEPTYIKKLPVRDAWGRDFRYESNAIGSAYTITSFARDGSASGPSSGPITSFSDDLRISDGTFLTWPEGIQVE